LSSTSRVDEHHESHCSLLLNVCVRLNVEAVSASTVATNTGEKKRHVLLYGLTNDLEWVRFPEQGAKRR